MVKEAYSALGASLVSLVVKNSLASAGDIRDVGSVPGLGRSPGGGSGNPLQYSCLENPMDRGDIRDVGMIPGSGRSPGEGNGHPLWYSCLENPMEGGAWQAIVHGVTKSHKELDMTEAAWHARTFSPKASRKNMAPQIPWF